MQRPTLIYGVTKDEHDAYVAVAGKPITHTYRPLRPSIDEVRLNDAQIGFTVRGRV